MDFFQELMKVAAEAQCDKCRFHRPSNFAGVVWCILKLDHKNQTFSCGRFESKDKSE